MASQYGKYRFQNVPLDDDTFNARWRDIDLRLDTLEGLGFTFKSNEDALVAVALKRINEALLPVIEQIQDFAHLGDLLRAPSASELTIGMGAKTFVIDASHRRIFAAPLFVIAAVAGRSDVWMAGQVLAWDSTTGALTIAVTRARGSGVHAGWVLSVCSIPPDLPPAQSAAAIVLDPIPELEALDAQEAFVQLAARDRTLGDAVQEGLAAKAPLASPAFTGVPTAPAPPPGSATGQLATTGFVTQAIAGLMNSAPGQLDTLSELAAALGNDPNFAASITAALSGKTPMARQVTGGGLASGGGDLTADRVLTVPIATQAQAQLGSDNAAAMTPLRTAQAIAALGSNAVKQIKYVTAATPFASNAAGFTDVTGMSLVLTPTSVNARILLLFSSAFCVDGSRQVVSPALRFLRDATPVGVPAVSGIRTAASAALGSGWPTMGDESGITPGFSAKGQITALAIDGPAALSALTYKLQLGQASGGVCALGRSWGTDANSAELIATMLFFMAIEVLTA